MDNRKRLLALVPVLALVACSPSVPLEERVQRVSFCEGTDHVDAEAGTAPNRVVVKFWVNGEVSAQQVVEPGSVLTRDLPLGTVAVYVDDVLRITASDAGDASADDPYTPPSDQNHSYFAGNGCPATPLTGY